MADYRPDCGCFLSHTAECRARSEANKKVQQDNTNTLDSLYAVYGQLMADAARTSHDTRLKYQWKADGLLMAIHIVEGKDG